MSRAIGQIFIRSFFYRIGISVDKINLRSQNVMTEEGLCPALFQAWTR